MKSQLVALATLFSFCNLSGTARSIHRGPIASVGPQTVVFATQPDGTTSPPHTITLTNAGSAPLSISGISIRGANAGGFGYTTACGSNLAAGGTCAINVNFTPTLIGAETATLVISDNSSSGATQSVALSGTGQAALNHSVTLSWTPSSTTDVSSYNIYRCLGSGCTPSQNIGSVPAETTNFADVNVAKGSTYTYAVSAVDSTGQSALSVTAIALIPN